MKTGSRNCSYITGQNHVFVVQCKSESYFRNLLTDWKREGENARSVEDKYNWKSGIYSANLGALTISFNICFH